jgi:hypothetical protein
LWWGYQQQQQQQQQRRICSENLKITISYKTQLVPMAMQSKAFTVFGCSNTGIVGLNPTQGMDMCLHFPVFV